jgi:hypothetical protein
LLAITFLPVQEAYAGACDYLRNKVNTATSYVTSSSTYKNYVSPTVNRISNNSAVSALTKGLGSIPGGVRTSLASGGNALFPPLRLGIGQRLTNLSNTIGKSTGLWGTKPAQAALKSGAVIGMYRKIGYRTEITRVPLNESINKSVRERLLRDININAIDK